MNIFKLNLTLYYLKKVNTIIPNEIITHKFISYLAHVVHLTAIVDFYNDFYNYMFQNEYMIFIKIDCDNRKVQLYL